jgi:hypothetical protein
LKEYFYDSQSQGGWELGPAGEARPVKVKKGWAVATEWPAVREMLKKVLDRFPEAKRAVLEGMDQLEMEWDSVVILEKV